MGTGWRDHSIFSSENHFWPCPMSKGEGEGKVVRTMQILGPPLKLAPPDALHTFYISPEGQSRSSCCCCSLFFQVSISNASLRRTLHHFVNKFWRNFLASLSFKCPKVPKFHPTVLATPHHPFPSLKTNKSSSQLWAWLLLFWGNFWQKVAKIQEDGNAKRFKYNQLQPSWLHMYTSIT